jgi:HD superfamily phosphohydrolase
LYGVRLFTMMADVGLPIEGRGSVADPYALYEIRCPVHGFITINDWEREIINQPAFQRLRRIRQLAWTDQVYPGAMHTRFEHSLGVMHVATKLYTSIVSRFKNELIADLRFDDAGLRREECLVRLTALLHDIGHAPFSHAGEELFPYRDGEDRRYKYEHYSSAIIRNKMRDVIEDHPFNQNYHLKADEVANLLEGNSRAGRALVWRELVSGQMDADRIDYLIRDSLHTGVDYGKFDWRRLVNTVALVTGKEDGGPRLGISEDGFHAAEGLVLARYFMFTQVYFHKTRTAYDVHLRRALAEMLPGQVFSRPDQSGLDEYLKWDDWRVLGELVRGAGGEHGRRLAQRDHYRKVYHTPDSPSTDDLNELKQAREALGELLQSEEPAQTSTYKTGMPDIPVVCNNPNKTIRPLSEVSSLVRGLQPVGKVMLYCRKEDVDEAKRRISATRGARA